MEAVITAKQSHVCPMSPKCKVVCMHGKPHEHHDACNYPCSDTGVTCEEVGVCHFCEQIFPVSMLEYYEDMPSCPSCLGRIVAGQDTAHEVGAGL